MSTEWTDAQLERGRRLAEANAKVFCGGAPEVTAQRCRRIRIQLAEDGLSIREIVRSDWGPCESAALRHAHGDCQHDHDVPPVEFRGSATAGEWHYVDGTEGKR